MRITLYGISNCDTVKRARAALDAAGLDYRFHDFRRDGLDAALAQRWIDILGADALINRRGTTWRRLDAAEQERAATEPAALLADHPSLVKRPVIEAGSRIRVGFPKATAQAVIEELRQA